MTGLSGGSPAAASSPVAARWSSASRFVPSAGPGGRGPGDGAAARGRSRSCQAASSDEPFLDAWIRIDADGDVTVFTGKAELGQGVKTAILQVAAEELEVEPAAIELVTADTGRTPDEGYTAGSQSMQNSGTAIRHAAAQVREILIARRRPVATPMISCAPKAARPSGPTDGRSPMAHSSPPDLHVEAPPQSRLKRQSLQGHGQPCPASTSRPR